MLTEISGPKIKNEHNIGFKNLSFSILAWVGQVRDWSPKFETDKWPFYDPF